MNVFQRGRPRPMTVPATAIRRSGTSTRPLRARRLTDRVLAKSRSAQTYVVRALALLSCRATNLRSLSIRANRPDALPREL